MKKRVTLIRLFSLFALTATVSIPLLTNAQTIKSFSDLSHEFQIDKQAKSQTLVASILRPILPQLKRETKVPILLPSQLPNNNIYVCSKIQNNGYNLILGSSSTGWGGQKHCSPPTAAYVGFISAQRGGKLYESSDKVRLIKNISANYEPRSYKVPPSISWIYKGVVYSISIKEYADGKDRNPTQAKAYLIGLANSAIKAGPR
jgi:hypothetical protein